MVIRHGGLTAAERLKKAAEVCKQECSPYCPYWTEDECHKHMMEDCVEAIAERDERLAIMQESMETLEKRCNALEALEQRCKALEKRNEPIEPIVVPIGEDVSVPFIRYKCPKCDMFQIEFKPNYCSYCGQAVKWE